MLVWCSSRLGAFTTTRGGVAQGMRAESLSAIQTAANILRRLI